VDYDKVANFGAIKTFSLKKVAKAADNLFKDSSSGSAKK
jgi:hypothetical protein